MFVNGIVQLLVDYLVKPLNGAPGRSLQHQHFVPAYIA